MRSIFGWDLPPGCGRLPGEEEMPPQPRCCCGRFIAYGAVACCDAHLPQCPKHGPCRNGECGQCITDQEQAAAEYWASVSEREGEPCPHGEAGLCGGCDVGDFR